MISNYSYSVQKIKLIERRIQINDFGESNEVLDFLISLKINGLLRREELYYTKAFKEVKRYLKMLKKEVPDLYDLELPQTKEK